MSHLLAFGHSAGRIHFRTLLSVRWTSTLLNSKPVCGESPQLSRPSQACPPLLLSLSKSSDLRTTAYTACKGAAFPPSPELREAILSRSLHRKQQTLAVFVQRSIATTTGRDAAASADGLVTRPVTGDGSLADRADSAVPGSPSPRLVEIDMEDLEKERRKLIKRNNFYGKMLLGFLLTGGALMYLAYAASDVSSGFIRHMDGLLELLYELLPENFPDPEMAHHFVMWLAARGYLPYDLERDDPELSVNIKGVTFHTPVGLAAGFDKDAQAPLGFCKMGFGFVEVGTITPKPQPGNPKPRIFRLTEDRAIINRCGFNSAGLDVAEPRLKRASVDRWQDRLARRCVLGVNIGKNKDTEQAEEDIREGIRRVGRFADYLVINLSSPNTQGLRALQQRDHLRSIIVAAQSELDKLEQKQKIHETKPSQPEGVEERANQAPHDIAHKAHDFFPTQTGRRPLLFVKIAPDLTDQEKRDIADVALETGLDGLIVTNTTIQRPESLQSKSKQETGGLSGRPLKAMATQCVSDMYKMTNGQVAIIASGGIETGLDAYQRIRAGASAVEVYSSLVRPKAPLSCSYMINRSVPLVWPMHRIKIYRGPVVARRIKDELLSILNQAGIYNVQDAVGLDHRPPKKRHVQKPTFK